MVERQALSCAAKSKFYDGAEVMAVRRTAFPRAVDGLYRHLATNRLTP
jgi:hypothetical protein